MRKNSRQKEIQALCANPPSEPTLVQAAVDIHVRSGYISRGGNFEGSHRWGSVVPQGTVGIIEGSYEGRTLISFEQRDGYFVTDTFEPHEYAFV